jgi:hypothetical protein
VDEVRVHDVRLQRADHPSEQERIDVSRRSNSACRDSERAVKVDRIRVRVVEPDERDVDPALGKGGKEGEEMSLGAADSADPMDVNDSHLFR